MLDLLKSILPFKTHLDDTKNSIQSTQEKLKYLRNSYPPKADVIAHMESVADRLAATNDAALKFTIDRLAADPLNFDKTDGIAVLSAAPLGAAASFKTMEAALLALFGGEIKKSLRKRIEEMPWPKDVGPRIADRPALIEKAERELTKLESDLTQLRAQAAEAGIII